MGTLRRAPFGRTGMDITRVGFGAWAIGGAWQWGWGQVRTTPSRSTPCDAPWSSA